MKRIIIFALLVIAAFFTPFDLMYLEALQGDSIQVTIRGEVEQPGTYRLERYATIEDGLQKAGIKETADLSSLNPLAILADRDVLNVPAKKEEGDLPLVSINTASQQELETLPGIGPAMAQRIIADRNENGLFQTIEDLTRVKGIGEASLEKLKDRIRL